MIVNVFCTCKCGQQTGYRNLPPGYRLKSKLHGLITDHNELIVTVDHNKSMLANFNRDRAIKSRGI